VRTRKLREKKEESKEKEKKGNLLDVRHFEQFTKNIDIGSTKSLVN
jgi:hypothetical protein